MSKFLFKLIPLLLFPCFLHAQIKVDINVHIPRKTTDNLYLAGNFNNWRANNEAFRLQQKDSLNYFIRLNLPPEMYEYKVARAEWSKVEVQNDGKSIPNRFFRLKQDTAINITVASWADFYKQTILQHSYSKNVHIADTAFYIPQLNKFRRIWIYLPPSYKNTGKRYPVLYMHDGQNLFDVKTSGYGEWGIDEILDSLNNGSAKQMIVVGIDHGGDDRLKEYNPYNSQYGKAEGKAYADFLVKTLKPYIDKNYHTLRDTKHTAIAGSSMGGLISMYALAKYPKIFGSAGIFSPAFWLAPNIYADVAELLPKSASNKIYFVAGAQESKGMLPNMERLFKQLNPEGKNKNIVLTEKQDGKHSEWFWHREFVDFYKFILR